MGRTDEASDRTGLPPPTLPIRVRLAEATLPRIHSVAGFADLLRSRDLQAAPGDYVGRCDWSVDRGGAEAQSGAEQESAFLLLVRDPPSFDWLEVFLFISPSHCNLHLSIQMLSISTGLAPGPLYPQSQLRPLEPI